MRELIERNSTETGADIFVSIKNGIILKLIKNLLGEQHRIFSGNIVTEKDADLFIIDYSSFRKQEKQLQLLKQRRSPLFIPVILLTHKNSALRMKESVWDIADDILPLPMPRKLLQNRVDILLRTRCYSLELQKKNRREVAEKQTLLQEVHHRVKNNLAIVSGLLELQMMEVEDDTLSKILMDNQARIISIAKVHEMLYQNQHLSRIEFDGYIRNLADTMTETYQNRFGRIDLELNLQPVFLSIDQAVPCGLILNELMTNAIKHAFPEQKGGTITVLLKEHGDTLTLTISDDGVGMDHSFDIRDQQTLGATIIQLLVNQLCADFTIQTGPGTLFKIAFEKTRYSGPSKKLDE